MRPSFAERQRFFVEVQRRPHGMKLGWVPGGVNH
jgi:hypothetical protein